jgi:hypothetical protein
MNFLLLYSSMNTADKIKFKTDGFVLGDIADIMVAYQARERIEKNSEGDFWLIRPQDFDEFGNLLFDDVFRFNPFENVDPHRYFINNDDILFQARGNTHCAYYIKEPLRNSIASNAFYLIRVYDRQILLPEFLAWYINQSSTQAYFEQSRGVSTISFVSKKILSKTPITIPPIKLQKRIIEMMALWIREQELTQWVINKKDELITAVLRNAANKGE